jgi:kinesin family member C1
MFNEVKSFVQSAMDGENVCIFAYGQTGAGKTYTMEGPPFLIESMDLNNENLDELSGIIPRTAEFLLREVERLKKLNGREFFVEVSSIEVYCDTVKDLYGNGPDANDLNIISIKDKVVIQG